MALRTAPRPIHAAPAQRRSSGGGKLIVVFLVAVALGVGYLAHTGKLPGLPQTQTTPTGPALPAESLNPYIDFWNDYSEAVPREFSVSAVTGFADECADGGMVRNSPQYLDADQIGRARGGYVCLMGIQPGAPDSKCPALGTNDWRSAQRPRLPDVGFVVHGHIIGKTIGGIRSEVRNGHCVNMVPQSTTPNGQMGNQAEKYAKGLAQNNETIPIYYIVVPIYTGGNYMPDAMHVFMMSPLGPEPRRTYINETFHIAAVGGVQ